MNVKYTLKVGLVVLIAASFFTSSCDKIKNPYKAGISTTLDTNLYPGNWSDYVANQWPTFNANTNTDRNILIEDFTGHLCPNCPAAAVIADTLLVHNPTRVIVASIHSGPTGVTNFQEVTTDFPEDFTNPIGLAYGVYFNSGYGFTGNPEGPISRSYFGGIMFSSPGNWTANVASLMSANVLKVNIQSAVNYYPSTRGLFLHTEVEPLVTLPSSARMIVYFIENLVIAPQKNNVTGTTVIDDSYHHQNIHRGNIDNLTWGRVLSVDSTQLTIGNKLHLDYSYKIPDQYDPTNCHLVIYVEDDNTKEVLQVIKQDIQ